MGQRGGRRAVLGGAMVLCAGMAAGIGPATAEGAAGHCEAEWHVTITRGGEAGPAQVASDVPGTVQCSGVFDGHVLSGDPARSRLIGTIGAVDPTTAAAGCLLADSDLLYSVNVPAIGYFEPSRVPMIGEITGRLGAGAFAVSGDAFAVSSDERSALTGAGTFTADAGGACSRAGSGVLRVQLALSPDGQGAPPEMPADATSQSGAPPAQSGGTATTATGRSTGRSRMTARHARRRRSPAHRRHDRHGRAGQGAGGQRRAP